MVEKKTEDAFGEDQKGKRNQETIGILEFNYMCVIVDVLYRLAEDI
jgi:hypothetical protein